MSHTRKPLCVHHTELGAQMAQRKLKTQSLPCGIQQYSLKKPPNNKSRDHVTKRYWRSPKDVRGGVWRKRAGLEHRDLSGEVDGQLGNEGQQRSGAEDGELPGGGGS